MRLIHRGSKAQVAVNVPEPANELSPKSWLKTARHCQDGLYVGDEVYGTNKGEREIFWFVGRVTKLDSTDLIEVRWDALTVNPYGSYRLPLGSQSHLQFHSRAELTHLKCRKAN